jgi:hypothetical protein
MGAVPVLAAPIDGTAVVLVWEKQSLAATGGTATAHFPAVGAARLGASRLRICALLPYQISITCRIMASSPMW